MLEPVPGNITVEKNQAEKNGKTPVKRKDRANLFSAGRAAAVFFLRILCREPGISLSHASFSAPLP